jgi:hypothetical protein
VVKVACDRSWDSHRTTSGNQDVVETKRSDQACGTPIGRDEAAAQRERTSDAGEQHTAPAGGGHGECLETSAKANRLSTLSAFSVRQAVK